MIRMFSLGSMLSATAGLLLASTVTVPAPQAQAQAQDACAPHAIDLGDGKSAMGGCKPLKIAFLIAATNNTHLQAQITGAQDAAKEIGATLYVFDPNWSPTPSSIRRRTSFPAGCTMPFWPK